MRWWWLVALAACGNAPEDLGPTGLLALPGHGTQLVTEPYDLTPGQERTVCYAFNLKNTEPLDVERIATARRPGQHHFNLFLSSVERPEGLGPCPNNIELFTDNRPIADGSGSAIDVRFPTDTALRLPVATTLVFQLHWINTTVETLTQQFVLNLHTRQTPAPTLVDVFGFTNFELDLAPHAETIATKDCVMRDEMGILTMSAHFHARGVEATAGLIHGGEGDPEPLYRTDRWDNPDVKVFETSQPVRNGDVIRFSCRYQNDGDEVVKYGAEANDEMCFLFGYYFPKRGLIPCF